MANKKSTKEQRKKAKDEGKAFEKQVFDYLRVKKIFFLHITTYVKRLILCRFCKKPFLRMFPIEGTKGFPDFFLFLPGGRLVFVECKHGKGKLSVDQNRVKKKLTALGFPYYIVKTIEDAIKIIDEVKK